jgi:hypothetical protein
MGLSDLPLASGKDHRKTFEKFGWILRRDGNHIVMTTRTTRIRFQSPTIKK